MSKNTIFLAIALLSSCKALDDSRSARILQYDFENIGTGPYQFKFETSDGTKREEQGTLVNENTDHAAVIVKGSYSYTDKDGKVFTVRYTADENGFHPEGDHIKVPPFVPWTHHHQHDDGHGHNIQSDTPTRGGSNQGAQVYLPSTPARPEIPIQYIPSTTASPNPGLQFIQSTTSNPGFQFVQSTTPNPGFQFVQSTTPNPEIQREYFPTSPRPINLLGDGIQSITNTYIPTTPRNIPFANIDPRIQRSIVNLISTGDGRGLSIEDINSL